MLNDDDLQNSNPDLYRIAREGGTERPGTSKYLSVDADGVFHCAICAAALFRTDEKFDSGTGWPSFTEPVSKEAVRLLTDESHGMVRTEVRCAKCDAHLGHVFPDGPRQPDGARADRYCINGICLNLEETK